MNQPPATVTVTDAAARASAGEVLLLDVREPHEWEAGHAADAVHLPLSAFDPAAVPTDRPVYAICRSGKRSAQATEALLGAGIDVTNVEGGMLAWDEAGLPVTTDGGTPGSIA